MRFALRPPVDEGEQKQACKPSRPVESINYKLISLSRIYKFKIKNLFVLLPKGNITTTTTNS